MTYKVLPQTEQFSFLLASKEASQYLEAKVLLFQLSRTQKIMQRVLGQWGISMRCEKTRQIARTIDDRDERLRLTLRDYYMFNVRARVGKMSINRIERVWLVFGTELREEIKWDQQ